MNISLENIIELVTREVIKELTRRGYAIDQSNLALGSKNPASPPSNSMELCMKDYVSPVLTENRFDSIPTGVNELIIPAKTIVTPGAKDMIRKRNIKLIYKS